MVGLLVSASWVDTATGRRVLAHQLLTRADLAAAQRIDFPPGDGAGPEAGRPPSASSPAGRQPDAPRSARVRRSGPVGSLAALAVDVADLVRTGEPDRVAPLTAVTSNGCRARLRKIPGKFSIELVQVKLVCSRSPVHGHHPPVGRDRRSGAPSASGTPMGKLTRLAPRRATLSDRFGAAAAGWARVPRPADWYGSGSADSQPLDHRGTYRWGQPEADDHRGNDHRDDPPPPRQQPRPG